MEVHNRLIQNFAADTVALRMFVLLVGPTSIIIYCAPGMLVNQVLYLAAFVCVRMSVLPSDNRKKTADKRN